MAVETILLSLICIIILCRNYKATAMAVETVTTKYTVFSKNYLNNSANLENTVASCSLKPHELSVDAYESFSAIPPTFLVVRLVRADSLRACCLISFLTFRSVI